MTDQPDPPDAPASEDVDSPPNPELDELFDDPVLYPPDTRTPDEIAFFEDLQAYDNSEIYGDPSVPHIYDVRIRNLFLPQYPALVHAKLDGDILTDFLQEIMFILTSQDPDFPEKLKREGLSSLEEYKRTVEDEDPEMLAVLKESTARFFLRHFPKFLLAAYNLAILSSIMGSGLALWRQTPDEGLHGFEGHARDVLKKEIAALEKMIKEIVGTRSSGRPKKIVSTRGLPEIVNQVINTALGMMCDRRGEDAVPGLKQIAVALNFSSSEALGKQLKRSNYPWLLSIKPYLAALPSPDKNPS